MESTSYGSIPSRERRRPPRPNPITGNVTANNNSSGRPPKISTSHVSSNAPSAMPKKKISAGKHRIDSWAGLGAATRNAIFDNLGDNFDLGAIAGGGVGASNGTHPLSRDTGTGTASINESTAHPLLRDNASNGTNHSRVPIPRGGYSRRYGMHKTPSQSQPQQQSQEQQEYSPDRESYLVNGRQNIGSLFTISSNGESFYEKKEFESKTTIIPGKTEEENLLQRIHSFLFGCKNKSREKQHTSKFPMEVDAFSKYARGEDANFELTSRTMGSDEEESSYG